MRSSLALAAFGLLSATHAANIDQELDEGIPDTGLDTSSWTEGSVPPLEDMLTVNDFQIAAKNYMSAKDYAYYRTAALDEITYIKNLEIWQKLRINGFTFRDVSEVDTSTTILGYNFSLPFFIAPAAAAGRANDGAEANLVKAAGNNSMLYVPSISSTLEIEEIAAAAEEGQVMFHQEYIWDDEDKLQDELDRMEKAGFKAVFLTVDNTGTTGIRNRYMRFKNSGESSHSAKFTIPALDKIRRMTDLPIVPKGVKTAHDVKLCADLGFPAVYISNHGGRMVDGVPTAVEILLDLHASHPEVFDQIEIYADGGVRRSTHVLALLALGARAVGMARPFMFANVLGTEGLDRLVSLLRTELRTEMMSMGEGLIDGYRGNATYINTKQIELEYFGAPLTKSLNTSPFYHKSPVTSN